MSGADKFHMTETLKKMGWVEVSDNLLAPPPELFEKAKALTFHVYDARDLQYLLAESVEDYKEDGK